MLKALLAAILVALVIVILLLLPISRPDRRVAVSDSVPPASSGFVIHNDAPPTPTPTLPSTPPPPAGFVIHDAAQPPPAASPPATPSPATPDPLDAAIQRLRSGKPDATVTVTPAPASTSLPAVAPAVAPATAPAPVAVPRPLTPPASPPPPRWTNVTGQGVQFRIAQAGDGFLISIDLGGGQVAEVHAALAFGHLDPAAINTRVDYLKQTILTDFAAASGSYLFNRDGSVTRGR